ncbi:ABC transporter permease [Massilibacteroides sp.]|uniref:ABC transporter permease n=1 Tax=Massilibacteroides sp. TaxID=2034766 RepID=UPI00262EE67E|nr:ABC transporter permease [Massilibacteroides sp.]MDD4516043.1 ABC transporter permease [Massilibacteroides sp.]
MYKQYFKQALQSIRENPLVSSISIAGTAFSIAMIMVVVMIFQIKSANYAPETKRDRMLYIQGTQVTAKNESNRNRGNMSSEVVRECFYSLQSAEAVTAIFSMNKPISLPGKRMFNLYSIKYTDAGFWDVFDFKFINGKPFSKEDFSSGIAAAVVSETMAKEVFGTTDVVGKTCILDFTEYTIRGVVTPVSRAAQEAFADLWIPYTSKNSLVSINNSLENMAGVFSTCILAKKRADFEQIKEELAKRTAAYNAGKKENVVDFLNNPISKLDIAMGSNGFNKKPIKDFLVQTGSILLFLLFVPALNLTGVIQSSVQKRQAEIGVRKAFGATSQKILSQVLWENLILTLIGMAIGTILSFLFLIIGKSFLLTAETQLNFDMLFKPGLFIAALLFTGLLNLFSAGIPALYISKKKITDTLSQE